MLDELIASAVQSSAQGVVGVSLIVLYFILITGTAVYRIRKAEHMKH